MSLRFRRSFRVMPGVRINLSKSGLSTTFGVRGASINVGQRGVHGTVGLPGTGLSYRARLGAQPLSPHYVAPPNSFPDPSVDPSKFAVFEPFEERVIASGAIESRTSGTLEELRQLIVDARRQRLDVSADLTSAELHKSKLLKERAWKNFILWRRLFRTRLSELSNEISDVDHDIASLHQAMNDSQISADFEIPDAAGRTYGAVCSAFEDLRKCARTWHVPSERDVDRVRTRSAASFSIRRNPVSVGFQSCSLLSSEAMPMRFQNPDGEDIFIYPSMAVMPRSDGAFALVDLRELSASLNNQPFVEDETVPPDAQIIRYAWEKSNRDGSRDKRFADNRQIPVCLYGEINFSSKNGVQERYSFSNSTAAAKFTSAFAAHVSALSLATI